MRPVVQLQTSGIVENLGARGTPERVLVAMDSIVSFQRRSVEKRLGADIAFVGFFVAFVNKHVLAEITERFVAHVALVIADHHPDGGRRRWWWLRRWSIRYRRM